MTTRFEFALSSIILRLGFLLICAVLVTSAAAPRLQADEVQHATFLTEDFRGWNFLVARLHQSGVDEQILRDIYQDSRMPKFSWVTFRLQPREPQDIYQGFFRADRIKLANDFISSNRALLSAAEDRFGVSACVISSILLVETQFGRITGRELVINRLSRLAGVRDPENLKENFRILSGDDSTVTFEQVQDRAQYLEDTFLPEVIALITKSNKLGQEVFDFRGSRAGAMGIPQFLPGSYLRFGVDGSGNGAVSLFDMQDAVFSVANYLRHFGWRPGIDNDTKREAIWNYNRSDAYIDTVLRVSEMLSGC